MSRRKRAFLPMTLLSLLILPAAGCSSDGHSEVDDDPDSGTASPADAGVVGDAESVVDSLVPEADGSPATDAVSAVGCDLFPDLDDVATTGLRYKFKIDEERGNAPRVMYVGEAAGGLFFRATVWQGLADSPTGPGTIDLAGVPRDASAGALVRYAHGCDDKGRECTTEFVGFKGTLKISSLDWATSIGSTYAGSVEQIEFRQVTFKAEVPIEVPGGCSFTLASHAFSGTVTVSGDGDG